MYTELLLYYGTKALLYYENVGAYLKAGCNGSIILSIMHAN